MAKLICDNYLKLRVNIRLPECGDTQDIAAAFFIHTKAICQGMIL